MYDKFEPFKGVQKQPFTFTPSRYETWKEGKLIASGSTMFPIKANVINSGGQEKVEVIVGDSNLHTELAARNEFDEFITATDRLQLITIPAETNSTCVGIVAMQSIVGATRKTKHFTSNQPYCCNLFIQDGTIAKITFSFGSPEKLMEFYPETESVVPKLDFVFKSSLQIRWKDGVIVSDAKENSFRRSIQIDPNPDGDDCTLSVFNLEERPTWETPLLLGPKRMKLISQDREKIELRIVGSNTSSASFVDYGLIVYHKEGVVSKVVLIMHNKGEKVEYLP